MDLRESCCSCGQVSKSDRGKEHRDRKKIWLCQMATFFSNQEQGRAFPHLNKYINAVIIHSGALESANAQLGNPNISTN